tara:strand:+ start:353 stop:655 length:303 start_codon:yes stop_codon:yes gene_type:complete
MISSKTIRYIKEVLKRLSSGDSVTLEERIYIQKAADEDQKVSSWLKRARRLQDGEESKSSVDKLINDLDLGPLDSDSLYKPNPDDLGNWFTGAPSWVSRS